MKHDLILRIGVKLILPFILLFALYVLFHGEYGPGGGFQAGVIAASVVILYSLIFGVDQAKRAVPQGLVERLIPLGLLLYAGVGLPAMALDRSFLDYGVLASNPASGHALGILLIETGVLITVASTMTAMFYAFADRGRA